MNNFYDIVDTNYIIFICSGTIMEIYLYRVSENQIPIKLLSKKLKNFQLFIWKFQVPLMQNRFSIIISTDRYMYI
jgi:hypothetical protein